MATGVYTFVVRVPIWRPAARSSLLGRRRVLLGVTWADADGTRSESGVRVQATFEGAPSAWRLVGGDAIVAVNGMPVQTAEDVVFHWDGAPPGEVTFDVRRTATDVVRVRKAAARPTALVWRGDGGAPVLAAIDGLGPDDLLPPEGMPPLPSLIVAVDGTPARGGDAVAALVQRAADEHAVLALRRDAPDPLEVDAASEFCCGPCWRTRVPRPRPRRAAAGLADGLAPGRGLAELAPALLEG